ncbi:MAG: ribonuclease J [Myxococcales bacterium]|nr:ribonuclease J [Myxococcales bacterium]
MSDSLTILPLGGCGEVGLNATLFIFGGQCILLDCGAFLGAENAPGVNKVVPGFEPVFSEGRRLLAVVLTHGHEDHIGALPALLSERDVAVFGTPLTCDLIRSRLERDESVDSNGRGHQDRLMEVSAGETFEVGPFRIEFVRVTHSVPHSVAVVVDTPAGRVVHTGDYRLDPEPWDGNPTDLARFKVLGGEGIDVLMADSTNAEIPGRGRSEKTVARELERQVSETRGRVAVTMMASHIHRMAALAHIAERTQRKLCLVGRTVERNWKLGVARGLLPNDPHLLVSSDRLNQIPRQTALVLATGSQGEWNGGVSKIAAGQDGILRMYPGDKIIFSARTIPGNELPVRRMLNQLARQGIETVGPDQAPVHASGHARQEEQRQFIETVRPKWFVPVYGERAMLEAHARTARAAGTEQERIMVIENGDTLILQGGSLRRGPKEPVSRRPLDGDGKVMDWGDIRDRGRLSRAGLLACSVVVDRSGRMVTEPVITARGIALSDDEHVDLVGDISRALDDPHLVSKELIANAVKHTILRNYPRRGPQVEVLLVALDRYLEDRHEV